MEGGPLKVPGGGEEGDVSEWMGRGVGDEREVYAL